MAQPISNTITNPLVKGLSISPSGNALSNGSAIPTTSNLGAVKPVANYAGTSPAFAPSPAVTHPSTTAAPIGAVKSQTTATDGSTTTTYHPPVDATQSSAPVKGLLSTQTPTPQGGNPYTAPLAQNSLVGSPVAGTAATGLLQAPTQNAGIGQNAADIAKNYGQQIANVGGQGARFEAGQLTTGTSPVAEGNAAVTAQSTSKQQQALAEGEAAALQGTGQQLTAQNQGQAGLTSAGALGNQGQGLLQTGLTSAAQLAQPELGSIGQVPFNPTTGNQGTILGSTQPGGLTAAGNLLGQFQGAQAVGAAPGLGQAAGTQAVAAAPGQTQAGIYGTQQSQVAQYTSALQQGQNLQSQLSDLITTFGLNPNDINAVNAGIQKIAQNTSSPQYKVLQNYVNDVANTYSQVLTPPGGSATDTSRGIATSMLDATAKGTSILSVMQSLDEAAKAKIAGIPTSQSGAPSNTAPASGGWGSLGD